MFHIKRPVKIAFLVFLALALLGALWIQSMKIHRMYKEVNRPTMERRQLADSRVHQWMTVEEVAQRCQVSVEAVFQALSIDPQPGDEKLPLKKLEEKYNKSREDMRQGFDRLQKSQYGQEPEQAS